MEAEHRVSGFPPSTDNIYRIYIDSCFVVVGVISCPSRVIPPTFYRSWTHRSKADKFDRYFVHLSLEEICSVLLD